MTFQTANSLTRLVKTLSLFLRMAGTLPEQLLLAQTGATLIWSARKYLPVFTTKTNCTFQSVPSATSVWRPPGKERRFWSQTRRALLPVSLPAVCETAFFLLFTRKLKKFGQQKWVATIWVITFRRMRLISLRWPTKSRSSGRGGSAGRFVTAIKLKTKHLSRRKWKEQISPLIANKQTRRL